MTVNLSQFLLIISFLTIGIFIGVQVNSANKTQYEFVFLKNANTEQQVAINGFACLCTGTGTKSWRGNPGDCDGSSRAFPIQVASLALRPGTCCKALPKFKYNNVFKNVFTATNNVCK